MALKNIYTEIERLEEKYDEVVLVYDSSSKVNKWVCKLQYGNECVRDFQNPSSVSGSGTDANPLRAIELAEDCICINLVNKDIINSSDIDKQIEDTKNSLSKLQDRKDAAHILQEKQNIAKGST